MKIQIVASFGALLLGASGIAAALLVPGADRDEIDAITAEGTAREVSLACGPDFEKTMGEATAGIGGEDSPTLIRTRTIVSGGEDASIQGNDLGTGDIRTAFEEGAFPGQLVVQPGQTPVLAASTTQRYQETGELAGLAMTPCVAPVSSQYLVGGSTASSASAQLVLTNVSGSPATVQVAVHTSTGTAGPSIISSTTVDAHSSQTLLVEAGVRDPRLALEVASTGGPVGAHLLTHEVDGIVGTGLESVTAGAEPATTVVIPGADLSGDTGAVDLRVANPGTEPATISITSLTGEGMEEVPGGQDVAIAAGTVLDLSMDGLQGDWSALMIESDQPVLGGARVDVEGDYAWLASAVPAASSAVSVPDTTSQLTLYSSVPAAADLTYYDHEGTEVGTENVPIDHLASVTSPEDASFILIEADHPLYAGALTHREIGDITGVAGVSVTPPPAAANDLLLQVWN